MQDQSIYDFRKRPVRRVNAGQQPFKAPTRPNAKVQAPALFSGAATVVYRLSAACVLAQVADLNGARKEVRVERWSNAFSPCGYTTAVDAYNEQVGYWEKLYSVDTSSVTSALIALGCQQVDYNV